MSTYAITSVYSLVASVNSVNKILVAFAQRCVYNKSVAFYTRLCI